MRQVVDGSSLFKTNHLDMDWIAVTSDSPGMDSNIGFRIKCELWIRRKAACYGEGSSE